MKRKKVEWMEIFEELLKESQKRSVRAKLRELLKQ